MRVGLLACMHVDMHTQYEAVCVSCGRDDVSDLNFFLFVQEVVDAALQILKKQVTPDVVAHCQCI